MIRSSLPGAAIYTRRGSSFQCHNAASVSQGCAGAGELAKGTLRGCSGFRSKRGGDRIQDHAELAEHRPPE